MQIHWLPKQWPVSASVLLSLPGANVPTAAACQSRPFWCRFLPHIHSCHTYSELTHTQLDKHTPTDISSHLAISLNVPFLFSKGLVTYVNGAGIDRQVNQECRCAKLFQLRTVTDLSVTLAIPVTCGIFNKQWQKAEALHVTMRRTNSISSIKCPLNWIWTCKPI